MQQTLIVKNTCEWKNGLLNHQVIYESEAKLCFIVFPISPLYIHHSQCKDVKKKKNHHKIIEVK